MPSILDQQGFSPLADMVHGFLWCLWCDKILPHQQLYYGLYKYLPTYFQLGEPTRTSSTYLSTILPAHACPNFMHHFKVADEWPADSNQASTQDYLHKFEHLLLILCQVQQHDRIKVDLHEPNHSALQPL
jgi:hypothetical protein